MNTPHRALAALLLAAATACAPPSPVVAGPQPVQLPTPIPSPGDADARARIGAALDSVFDDPAFASAFWGVLVRSTWTGETLYARNEGRMFVPASNVKLVTGAAALQGLGAEYRYRTPVVAAGPVRGGVLRGDLVVVGSGDPTISARVHDDPRAVFAAWADSLRARGITRIEGRVLGDDDVFDELPLGTGWAWDDVPHAYSAEISGLPMDEGAVQVRVGPGAAPGEPVRVGLLPATAYVTVHSEAATGAAGSARTLRLTRSDDGRTIHVAGTLAADAEAYTERFAVPDNTLYFATVLRETLVERGIAVVGGAAEAPSGWDTAGGVDTLFVHRSPPLPEVLAAMMKPSQNQVAEILLKTLGAELRGMGTAGAGIQVVDSLFRADRLPHALLSQADGSGMSRYNLMAPALFVALLERERRRPDFPVFVASLPVAGVDGTLAGRMRGTPLEGRVRAKTGTLNGVRSLSGYLETAAGEMLVFSMLVNHHTLSARDADRVAEAALLRLHAVPPVILMSRAGHRCCDDTGARREE